MKERARRHGSVMEGMGPALAAIYAEALLGLLDGPEAVAAADEIEAVVGLLDEIDGFEELLVGPLRNKHQKAALIERAFGERIGERVEGLLVMLARNGRLGLLRPVAREFRRQLNVRQGKVEVAVTTAAALDESQRDAVTETLREALGAEPVLKTRVDRKLLGGMMVRVGDRLYDASTATRLRWIGRRLSERIAAGT